MAYSITEKNTSGFVTSFSDGTNTIDISYEPVSTIFFWEQVANKGFLKIGEDSVFSFSIGSVVTGENLIGGGYFTTKDYVDGLFQIEEITLPAISLTATVTAGDYQSDSDSYTQTFTKAINAKLFSTVIIKYEENDPQETWDTGSIGFTNIEIPTKYITETGGGNRTSFATFFQTELLNGTVFLSATVTQTRTNAQAGSVNISIPAGAKITFQ